MEDSQRDPWSEPRSFNPWWIAWLLLLVALGVVIYAGLTGNDNAEALAKIVADPPRLTLANDDGGNLVKIDRKSSPEVFCRVTLRQAPVGSRIELTCEWIAPDGKVVHRNRYHTKPIDKDPWPTHARCQFGLASPPGQWTVRMLQGDRELTSSVFAVVDGPQLAAEGPAAAQAAAKPAAANAKPAEPDAKPAAEAAANPAEVNP